jgi:hypothetical protein
MAGLLACSMSSLARAGTITRDLVVHLKFDNNFDDSSGRGNNGTAVGAPSFVEGKIGAGALRYSSKHDGSEFNYVTLGYPVDLQFGADMDFTISFWSKFSIWTADPAFVANKDWNSGSNMGYVIATAGDGHLQWNLRGDASGRRDYDGPPHTVDGGNWHHVVVTFSRTGDCTTYLDGAQVDSRSIAGSGNVDTIDLGLSVNIGQDGTGFYTDGGNVGIEDGTIDDVGFWQRVLAASEVGRIYTSGLAGISLADVPDPKQPVIVKVVPAAGATQVSPGVVVEVTIEDAETAVKPDTVKLWFDGSEVAAQLAKNNATNVVSYDPPGLLAALSAHSFKLVYGDTGAPTTYKTNEYQFTVGDYVNRVLPAPVYLETFDRVQEGELPVGWQVVNYTGEVTPGLDLMDPNSDSYKDWVVISRQRVIDIGVAGAWDAQRRLNVAPMQIVNGEVLASLVQGNFIYAESDQRGQSQVQYLFSPDFDLTGKTGVHLGYNSIYEQNQDSIGAVEYSIDEGKTWLPVVYMLDGPDIVKDAENNVDAVTTLTADNGDTAFYTDPDTGEQKGGRYGDFIGAEITAELAPFISARVNDDPVESKRFELFRLAKADNQPKVRFRFAQAGTASWYFGIDNFAVYSIVVVNPPGVTKPQDQIVSVGNSVMFESTVSGTGPFTYQWRRNGADLAGETKASLTIANVQLSDAGSFSVKVTNAGGSTESAAATLTVFEPVVTGQWDFERGDLSATVGKDLAYYDDAVRTGTRFGTTTELGVSDIGGTPAKVMEVPELSPFNGYIMRHGIPPNGFGQYVNQFTLIVDALYPAASQAKWKVFLQTNDRNANDGDIFINPAGGIGISGNYPGTTVPDTWYRFAFAFDLSRYPSPVLCKYINGVKVGEQVLGAGRDGRWALYGEGQTPDFALLFADNDGDNALMYANSVQMRNGRMSDAAIAALGGPSAAGIPGAAAPALRLTVSKQGDQIVINWTGGKAPFQLQRRSSLSTGTWENVGAPTTGSSASDTISGQAAFYRVAGAQ